MRGRSYGGVKAVHEENHPGTPLGPGTPVCPHAAAERIGISPVGRWYAATLAYLVEQGALEHNAKVRPDEVAGTPLYALGESAPRMMREA